MAAREVGAAWLDASRQAGQRARYTDVHSETGAPGRPLPPVVTLHRNPPLHFAP